MKNDWQAKVPGLDFDPGEAAQRRVWNQMVSLVRPSRSWKRAAAYAACAVFALALGATAFHFSALGTFGRAAELSESDCAELQSRFLLAKALSGGEETCPCRRHWNGYDQQTVRHLRNELKTLTGNVCSVKEQKKLHQCNLKYKPKLQSIALCKTLC